MSVDSKVERNLKSIKICTSDRHYPKYALHVFPDTAAIFNHNKVMIDQINGMPITIDVKDSILIGCRFSDSQFMAARNRTISQTGDL